MAVHLRAMGVLPVGSAEWYEVADTTGTPRREGTVPRSGRPCRLVDPGARCGEWAMRPLVMQMAGWELAPHFDLVVAG
jgi:hypothetical protein